MGREDGIIRKVGRKRWRRIKWVGKEGRIRKVGGKRRRWKKMGRKERKN